MVSMLRPAPRYITEVLASQCSRCQAPDRIDQVLVLRPGRGRGLRLGRLCSVMTASSTPVSAIPSIGGWERETGRVFDRHSVGTLALFERRGVSCGDAGRARCHPRAELHRRPSIRDGQVRPLLGDAEAAPISVYAVYPPGKHLALKVRALVDFLAHRFLGKPEWDRSW